MELDGRPIPIDDGDTIALAVLRAGEHPRHGGTLCLTGDCGSCVAEVDGVAYVRTCQTPARAGMVRPTSPRRRRTARGRTTFHAPRSPTSSTTTRTSSSSAPAPAARLPRPKPTAAGRDVVVLDAATGDEVIVLETGPALIVRRSRGTSVELVHLHAHEVVLATGAAELHPVCPGSDLRGLFTDRAARIAHAAGIALPDAVAVGAAPDGVPCRNVEGRLVRLEGDAHVTAAVVEHDGVVTSHPCRTAIFGLGSAPRDLLARISPDVAVRVVGSAAGAHEPPPPPVGGRRLSVLPAPPWRTSTACGRGDSGSWS